MLLRALWHISHSMVDAVPDLKSSDC